MKQRMIFFDIDGTIMGEASHKILPSTREAIHKARANGNLCIINTGRTKILVKKEITEGIGFDGYVMGCGAMITYHDEILMHQTFSKEMQQEIIENLRSLEIDAVLEGAENDYQDAADKIHYPAFQRFIAQFEGRGYGYWEDEDLSFDKFFAYTEDRERMKKFEERFLGRLEITDREHGYFEVMPQGVSKALGITYLSKHLGIPMENTVAIGDSNNDLTMLSCAHTSIAMGNASEAVRSMADYVTADVDQGGIWQALSWLGVF